ncbi:MAG: FAD-dependent oxidoreductase, partial [Bacteroidota bacterium]
MKEIIEVIVIGSGIAGLTVSSLLAKDGISVTLLEQNWLPGG